MFRVTMNWWNDSPEKVLLNSIGELSGTIADKKQIDHYRERKSDAITEVEIAQRVPGTREFIYSYVLCDTSKLKYFMDHLYR